MALGCTVVSTVEAAEPRALGHPVTSASWCAFSFPDFFVTCRLAMSRWMISNKGWRGSATRLWRGIDRRMGWLAALRPIRVPEFLIRML